MKEQKETQKICPKCKGVLAPKEVVCSKCETSLNEKSSGRIWLILGLFCILLSITILGGTFWYVEKRRSTKSQMTSAFAPINPTNVQSSKSLLVLNKLSSQQLLDLVPVKTLSRYRSKSGNSLPEQMCVIEQDADQYLVLIGSERIDSGDDDLAIPLVCVFKLDGETLSDVTREVLPFEDKKIGGSKTQVSLIKKGPDFDIKNPVQSDLFEPCNNCEQAYMIQEVAWCGKDYELGVKNWSNDPYTIFYVVAQALEKQSLDPYNRVYIDSELDPFIISGLEHNSGQKWTVNNLTTNNLFELKSLDKVSYALSNGIKTLIITVTKDKTGLWKATSLTYPDSDSQENSSTKSQ